MSDKPDAIAEDMAEKQYSPNSYTQEQLVRRKTRYYLNDYQRWKLAFSI